MAAKQGLSAQISQASEDAKRAVLNRTSLKSSLWFSNLNTTCTIKSAPPRSPEVLDLLASKSGYLFKRNEQHVWQSRWCCVVPHTFLYYFDAVNPNTVTNATAPKLSAKQQEMLNQAVQHGYGERGEAKPQQPRSSLYHVLGGTSTAAVTTTPVMDGSAVDTHGVDTSTLQPAGIIDLECYTTIHRNSKNELLLELAGDETVNPDLRSFYFCATSEDEGEEWTQALLSQRHSSLVDEKEAYQQVCDGFAQQLQMLHTQLDDAQLQAQNQQDELYRVRSQMEDSRRNCWRLVQDTLERSEPMAPAAKKAYKTDLETIQAQDLGLLAAVQLLCDYTRVLEETCSDSTSKMTKLQSELEQKTQGDRTRVQELEQELAHVKAEMFQQQAGWKMQLETLQQKYIASQKENQDVQKDLANQKVEMTMYQSTTRTKMNEWKEQKRVLKKEVLELRQVVKDLSKEVKGYRQNQSAAALEVHQERQKSVILERYVEKMESQVKVQQNMMEMMSAAGSVYGGEPEYQRHFDSTSSIPGMNGRSVRSSGTPCRDNDYGSVNGGGIPRPSSPVARKQPEFDSIIVGTPSSVNDDDDNDHGGCDDDDEVINPVPNSFKPPQISSSSRRNMTANNNNSNHNSNNNDDDKSHVSELTEDRTQKQFDAAYMYQHHHLQRQQSPNNALTSPRSTPLQTTYEGPPAVIGVSYEQQQLQIQQQQQQQTRNNQQAQSRSKSSTDSKLDTIMSARLSNNKTRSRNEIPRYESGSKMSSAMPPISGGGSTHNDGGSVASSKSKMSVAQRARMEADRQVTPVKLRVDPSSMKVNTPIRGNTGSLQLGGDGRGGNIQRQESASRSRDGNSVSTSSRNGFLANLGRRLEGAIDGSILGVDLEDDDEDDSASEPRNSYAASASKTRDSYAPSTSEPRDSYAANPFTKKHSKGHHDEKKVSEVTSETSTSLSLAERQILQRAQQLRFLKEQGLIKDETQVRGGAGSITTNDTGSVTSSAFGSPLSFGKNRD